ncbi:MAG TPA: pyridoxal-phosphate dependent enzyme [Polyangia bacterium]
MKPISDEARRLCRVTPLLYAPPLGCYLKLESLQATGSFKLRGAAVALSRLSPEERARGVVAASAGNHGLGLALAGARLSVPVTVVVSRTAAQVKRDGIARLGAEVIVSSGDYDQAEREARTLAASRGRRFISPFDDDDVIDGNGGWLAAELAAQHASLRRVIVPVGGGGLAGGLARALEPRGVEVIGIQPRSNCAMHESLRLGRALSSYQGGATRAEGLEGGIALRTFELARAHLSRIELVGEDEILAAVAFAWRALGLYVEPSAAVVLAAVRSGQVIAEEDTALVLTGANLDPALLDEALARFSS